MASDILQVALSRLEVEAKYFLRGCLEYSDKTE